MIFFSPKPVYPFAPPQQWTTGAPTEAWQRCPICAGSGTREGPSTSAAGANCLTCDGKGIISTVNGKPPA